MTIKTLDNDEPIEDFTIELEDKWKVGTKGTDRGILMVLVMSPPAERIEVGYGLEGSQPRQGRRYRPRMGPYAEQNDYDHAVPLGVQQLANVIAADAGVTLTPSTHQYHRTAAEQPISSRRLILYGIIFLFFLSIILRGTCRPSSCSSSEIY